MFDWLPTWWLLPSLKPRLQHDDKGLRNRGYGSGGITPAGPFSKSGGPPLLGGA
jgi:hypothetical protein